MLHVGFAFAVLVAVTHPVDPARAMVEKGVAFLIGAQNDDGSFGARGRGEVGITGLCIRGLVGAKLDGALAEQRDRSVARGANWLAARQQDDGSFAPERGGITVYRTALAMLALNAVDATAHSVALAKAKRWLIEAQVDEDGPAGGGWGYARKAAKTVDMSNSQLAIAALRECGLPADDPVMKRALAFVSRCQNSTETNRGIPDIKLVPANDGGFFYGLHDGEQPKTTRDDGSYSFGSYAGMSYAGLLSLGYAGLAKEDPRVRAVLGWVREHYSLDRNEGLGPAQDQAGLYYYYYNFARALHVIGVDELETKDGKRRWADDLLAALQARQSSDGSWKNENNRWMESLPVLATAYSLNAANLALEHRVAGTWRWY